MGPLLRVVVCVLAVMVMCQADCYFQELQNKDVKSQPKGCVDKEGVEHEFGSEWVKNCYECSCSEEGIGCCSKIPDAIDVPPQCELVVNRDACSAKMVLKSDKTKECSPV
ncbi:beta-microseminoprotein [Osmerus eperlanus]|uniref:beta-microseminoprotein n=1 Tax=Osmerus eperlanus TaxID=29151 RepID=UPI002E143018